MLQCYSINHFWNEGDITPCSTLLVDSMFTVTEASSFTPSVYSVHALTLLAEVNHLYICCLEVSKWPWYSSLSWLCPKLLLLVFNSSGEVGCAEKSPCGIITCPERAVYRWFMTFFPPTSVIISERLDKTLRITHSFFLFFVAHGVTFSKIFITSFLGILTSHWLST